MSKQLLPWAIAMALALTAPMASAQDDEGDGHEKDAVAAEEEESSGPHSFTGNLWVVSDYRFRGVSQSDLDAAFQAEFLYEHESGFYAGVWGSSVDFTPDDTPIEEEDSADIEVDYYVGWYFDLSDTLALDVMLTRYTFPDVAEGIDYDYNELIGKLIWNEQYNVQIGYSNDNFALGESGFYYGAGGTWDLPAAFKLVANVGYYDLEDGLGDSYAHWDLGVTRAFGPFELGLTYYDTDSSGEALFGEYADSKVVASAKFTF